MKITTILLLAIGFLFCRIFMVVCNNTDAAEQELRQMQKVMQACAGWVTSMSENFAAMKLGEVQKDALALLPKPVRGEPKIRNFLWQRSSRWKSSH